MDPPPYAKSSNPLREDWTLLLGAFLIVTLYHTFSQQLISYIITVNYVGSDFHRELHEAGLFPKMAWLGGLVSLFAIIGAAGSWIVKDSHLVRAVWGIVAATALVSILQVVLYDLGLAKASQQYQIEIEELFHNPPHPSYREEYEELRENLKVIVGPLPEETPR